MKIEFCLTLAIALTLSGVAADRELICDPHFKRGFSLLDPQPGRRVVYGVLPGLEGCPPVWDLAQWSSRLPLQATNRLPTDPATAWGNAAKFVIIGKQGSAEADLSLSVNAALEYPHARRSSTEPWVHLLVQQELFKPPALSDVNALYFHLEARLKRSRLTSTNDYSPTLHAAQFLVYFTLGNRNPNSDGYLDCFWFGIPVYDNREPIVPSYEAQDFGDTKLFIYTLSSATVAQGSTHTGEWITYKKDLLPLMLRGLEQAKLKGFIAQDSKPSDYRILGIFIGWEVPGMFDVDLQIRNLSLNALSK